MHPKGTQMNVQCQRKLRKREISKYKSIKSNKLLLPLIGLPIVESFGNSPPTKSFSVIWILEHSCTQSVVICTRKIAKYSCHITGPQCCNEVIARYVAWFERELITNLDVFDCWFGFAHNLTRTLLWSCNDEYVCRKHQLCENSLRTNLIFHTLFLFDVLLPMLVWCAIISAAPKWT